MTMLTSPKYGATLLGGRVLTRFQFNTRVNAIRNQRIAAHASYNARMNLHEAPRYAVECQRRAAEHYAEARLYVSLALNAKGE